MQKLGTSSDEYLVQASQETLVHFENENENESLLIPAVQHDIYHRIIF